MLLRRQGLPEEGELLLCEVKRIHFHSVFVKVLEYGIEGMIHISEIAPGRIRNIRDYVKEGKYIVCKALKVNQEKQQVDLSLRRVNERERREKTNKISLEKLAEKILEHAASRAGIDLNKAYEQVSKALFQHYDYLYDGFVELSEGKLDIKTLQLESKLAAELEQAIKEKIKPKQICLKGKLKLTTYHPQGIEIIREAVQQARTRVKGEFDFVYLGGGSYGLSLKANDYATCEGMLKTLTEHFKTFFMQHEGSAEFQKA